MLRWHDPPNLGPPANDRSPLNHTTVLVQGRDVAGDGFDHLGIILD